LSRLVIGARVPELQYVLVGMGFAEGVSYRYAVGVLDQETVVLVAEVPNWWRVLGL
jgi:hypothetical protein